jgi:Carboxypeptidase regulatory-like domain
VKHNTFYSDEVSLSLTVARLVPSDSLVEFPNRAGYLDQHFNNSRRGIQRSLLLDVAIAIICCFAICPACAQTTDATISGRVLDPSEAVVAGASVTATNTETHIQTKSITSSSGYYELRALKPGPYSLEVEASNFKKLTRSGIVAQVEDRIDIDLKLEIGSTTESVTVTVESPLLRTEDAQTGEVIDYQMIQDLPQYNRNPLTLITLSGDVQGSGAPPNGGVQGEDSDTRLNGGRTDGVDYLVDGVTVITGQAHAANAETPGTDAVQEFKVITNGMSADIGRVSGGIVTLATRSGTNDLHGFASEYYQNSALNDTSWQQKANGGQKSPYHQFDTSFGGGGPIILPHLYHGRNRTFFFAEYEGVREYSSGTLFRTQFPTDAERAGDLSGMFTTVGGQRIDHTNPLYQMYEPCYSPGDCSTSPVTVPPGYGPGTAGFQSIQKYNLLGGDGAHVPSSLISPVSTALLKFLPEPNATPVSGTSDSGNYIGSSNGFSDSDKWSARIDHEFSDKSRIFGRFVHASLNSGSNSSAPQINPANGSHFKGDWGLTLNYNYLFNPSLSATIVAGGYYNPGVSGNLLPSNFTTSNVGFDPTTQGLLNGNTLSMIVNFLGNGVDNNFDNQFGNPATSKAVNNTSGQLGGYFTKSFARHVLQFGAESRRYYDDTDTDASGSAFFIGDPVTQYSYDVGDLSVTSDMNGLGSFLLGINDLMSVSGHTTRLLAQNYYAGYVEDTYRVAPRLTLNLGLRWDMESPTTERHNRLYFWDPNAPAPFALDSGYNWTNALMNSGLTAAQMAQVQTPGWVTNSFPKGALGVAGTPEHPSRYATGYHPWQFAPRLGGAYRLGQKTVLRGFVGIMYLPTTGDPTGFDASPGVQLAGGAANTWHQNNFGVDPNLSGWSNPFTPGEVTPYTHSTPTANLQASGQAWSGGVITSMHMPHEYDWNFGIQSELPKGFLLEANYSATASHSLLAAGTMFSFPKNLYVPANQGLYSNNHVALPTSNSSNPPATNPPTIGSMEFAYPYFGNVQESGLNGGKDNFQSLNLRLEKRFKNGLQALFNYTLSQDLDDVGGPEADVSLSAGGTGSKAPQSVDNFSATYGLSLLDEKHRITSFYLYQLPFGRGRAWLGNPSGIGGHLLDGAVGGWEVSGTIGYRSGRPVAFSDPNAAAGSQVGVLSTYARCTWSCTNSDLITQGFNGGKSVLTATGATPRGGTAFNGSAFQDAAPFVYGDVPPAYGAFRNPGDFTSDLSLMKRFPMFSADEKRYLQFRAEAANAFNVAGLGNYNSSIHSSGFGTITSVVNAERHIQMSMKVVF